MANIINGKLVAEQVKNNIRNEVEQLKNSGVDICLAVILVGNDPASKVYVRNKKLACEKVGIISKEILFDENISQTELVSAIKDLNNDNKINGILVQLPLPKHLDEKEIIRSIDPMKDVDAFHPVNVGKIMIGEYDFLPCTPAGIVDLIDSTGIDICGKNCVVVGRSNIVGKPMTMLLLNRHGTVTVCHSKTNNLIDFTKNADILVAAVGIPNFITANMVKSGAVVIDVGINRMQDGGLCGDVDFSNVEKVAGYITPVPGGVGPMTIAKLMENTLRAAKKQNSI